MMAGFVQISDDGAGSREDAAGVVIEPNALESTLSAEELVAAFRILVPFLRWTGLRGGEANSLRKRDVDV